jgi:deoxycytidine triphosphate deaminase
LTILGRKSLKELCDEGLLSPTEESLIGHSSIDVRVGYSALLETKPLDIPQYEFEKSGRPENVFTPIDLNHFSKESPLMLPPGGFALVATLETFNVPLGYTCEFRITSSCARAGYDNALAVWVEGGFNNSVLTLEIKNNLQYHDRPLFPGLVIGQVIVHTVDGESSIYKDDGRYNGDSKVSASKGLKVLLPGRQLEKVEI